MQNRIEPNGVYVILFEFVAFFGGQKEIDDCYMENKFHYVAPVVEEFSYLVENGYALSQFETNDGGNPPLYSGGDPNDPDYYMGGPLGEETL